MLLIPSYSVLGKNKPIFIRKYGPFDLNRFTVPDKSLNVCSIIEILRGDFLRRALEFVVFLGTAMREVKIFQSIISDQKPEELNRNFRADIIQVTFATSWIISKAPMSTNEPCWII